MNLGHVRSFERAVNARDVDAAATLVTDDVEMGGPRGSARGVEVFQGWVADSGISLETVRLFLGGDTAVAVQAARWSGDGAVHEVVTLLAERDGRISRIVRYEGGALDVALAAAGLGVDDEVQV